MYVELCAQSYSPNGIPGAIDIQTGENRAFVTQNNQVVFRGTENPRNWFSDLDAIYTRFMGTWVHSGFLKYYLSLEAGIQQSVKYGYPIVIMGHSLGGAAALLAATRLPNVVKIITFGAPRVGNRAFRRLYRPLWGKTTCFVNQLDPVPWVPPALWDYRHAAPLEYYNGTVWEPLGYSCYLKILLKNLCNLDDLVQYHFIENYQKAGAP